jgi:hypothetical protein
MSPNDKGSHNDIMSSLQELQAVIHVAQLTRRVRQLEQAIRDHKKMVAAGKRYNIFLNDEAHKDLWSLVNDDFSASDQCD